MSKKRGTARPKAKLQERRWINPDLTWFVVRTVPNRERKVRLKLLLEARREGPFHAAETWLPQFVEVITRRGLKRSVDRQFFANYIFVGLNENDRGEMPVGELFNLDDVLDVLGADGPLAIPASVLQALADEMTGNSEDKLVRLNLAEELHTVGELRRVVRGPFASFFAQVTEILKNGIVKADVSIFGRSTPVEFEPADLEAAA